MTLGREIGKARGVIPALYLSHGAPPLVDDELWVSQLVAWAGELPKPTAILVVSAHWESAPLTIGSTTTETPLTYDFWGFPERYYGVTYDAPGAPDLAARIESLMPDDEPVSHDPDRRLDHGAYVPLTVMYPDATIPVLQISMPTLDPQRLLHLGERLRPLRDDGVLIIGSGFTTHGLPFLDDPSPKAATAGVVDGVRRLGTGTFRRRRSRLAYRLSRQGAGHALCASDDRALLAAVRRAGGLGRSGAIAAAGDRRLLDGPGQTLDRTRLTGYTVEPIEMDTRVDTHSELCWRRGRRTSRRDWHASYEAFVRAGEETALCTDDLDAMAVAAWRLGRGKESLRVAERVFAQLARTDPPSAAMKAVELGLAWFTRGDLNIAQGWMNRARRLLDGAPEGPDRTGTWRTSTRSWRCREFRRARGPGADDCARSADGSTHPQ